VHLIHGQVNINVFNTKMLSSFGVGCGHMGNKVLLNLDLGFLIIWSNSLGKLSPNVVAMIMVKLVWVGHGNDDSFLSAERQADVVSRASGLETWRTMTNFLSTQRFFAFNLDSCTLKTIQPGGNVCGLVSSRAKMLENWTALLKRFW
jgi:hypothetical protein